MALDLEKFNPTKAEITELAERYKALVINGVDDKQGYKIVDLARKNLKAKRVEITKAAKLFRDEAIKYQKEVIALERSLVAVIEPTEKELKRKQDEIDLLIAKEERRPTIPVWRSKFGAIGVELDEDTILESTPKELEEHFSLMEREKLEADQREVAAEKARLEAERIKLEREKEDLEREQRHQEELEAAKKEATEKAQRDFEAKQAEHEKQQKINAEAQERLLAEQKDLQEFYAQHGYSDESKDDFCIQVKDQKIILYKKVGEHTVKEWVDQDKELQNV